MNISRHAVGVAELIGPVPGKLITPLTQRVKHLSTSAVQGACHTPKALWGSQGIGLVTSAIVVFEVVNTPRCECGGI